MSDIETTSEDLATAEPTLSAAVHEAIVAFNNGDLEEALRLCREAMNQHPEAPEPHFVLGVVALRLGDEGQAISMFELAHEKDPDCREYAEALANVCMQVGRLADSAYYTKIADVLPSHPVLGKLMPPRLKDMQRAFAEMRPSTHIVEAERLFNVRSFDLALRECMAEIRLNSKNFDAYVLCARIALILGRLRQAVGALQAAIQLRPDSAMAAALLARALGHLGYWSDSRAQAARALAMARAEVDAESFGQALTALLLSPDDLLEEAQEHARGFAEAFDAENQEGEPPAVPADAPLRVGFVSNVFQRGPEARRFMPWFLLRRKNAHWIGYQQSVGTDVTTVVAKRGTSEWREIYDLDPYTLNYTIRSEELDVLVDLSQPDGDTRFGLVGLRPTRSRVGAFALPEPGLAPGVTHVLSDEVLEDADRRALLDGQELLVVKGSLFAEAPFRDLPQDTPLPAASAGTVTFAAMLDLSRLTAECALTWAELLHRTPGSRLMLIADERLSDEVRDRARDYFAYGGVADRVLFVLGVDEEPQEEEGEAEIADLNAIVPSKVWREVDIFLDTFPVNTPFVPAEALWSGVPVVTKTVARRLGRVGASVLNAAGRRHWISRSSDDYVTIACGLAGDVEELARERTALQQTIASSRLFDAEGTAKQVADLLRSLARTMRAG